MSTAITKARTSEIQSNERRGSVHDRRRQAEPVMRLATRWSANDCIRLSIAIPAMVVFILFISAVLWCVYTGRIDPASLGAFTEKAPHTGFSGNGLLGIGFLIVMVLVAVIWSGRGPRPSGRIG